MNPENPLSCEKVPENQLDPFEHPLMYQTHKLRIVDKIPIIPRKCNEPVPIPYTGKKTATIGFNRAPLVMERSFPVHVHKEYT